MLKERRHHQKQKAGGKKDKKKNQQGKDKRVTVSLKDFQQEGGAGENAAFLSWETNHCYCAAVLTDCLYYRSAEQEAWQRGEWRAGYFEDLKHPEGHKGIPQKKKKSFTICIFRAVNVLA